MLKEISVYEMTPDPGRALSLAICAYFVVNCDDLNEFCKVSKSITALVFKY